jgi:hypothetical protein
MQRSLPRLQGPVTTDVASKTTVLPVCRRSHVPYLISYEVLSAFRFSGIFTVEEVTGGCRATLLL